jgi:hypothetical protein
LHWLDRLARLGWIANLVLSDAVLHYFWWVGGWVVVVVAYQLCSSRISGSFSVQRERPNGIDRQL